MRHTLRLNGITLGWSDLEDTDPITGRAAGRFRPGDAYQLVQPIFQLYAESVDRKGTIHDQAKLERYYKSRDALPLELVDDDGAKIPVSAIHIADFATPQQPNAIELDVLISDERYWMRRA